MVLGFNLCLLSAVLIGTGPEHPEAEEKALVAMYVAATSCMVTHCVQLAGSPRVLKRVRVVPAQFSTGRSWASLQGSHPECQFHEELQDLVAKVGSR